MLIILLSLAVLAMAFAINPYLPPALEDEPFYGCSSLLDFADECYTDLFGKEDFVPSDTDGTVFCNCIKRFDAWEDCDAEEKDLYGYFTYAYKAFLGNNCAWPEQSSWLPYSVGDAQPLLPNMDVLIPKFSFAPAEDEDEDDILETRYPPSIQDCARSNAASIGLEDWFTNYEVCAPNGGAGVLGKWQEKWWIHIMQLAGRPMCFTDDVQGYSAGEAFCPVLEEHQGYGGCTEEEDSEELDILRVRRTACKCPYGEDKSPSGRRCEPIEKIFAKVEVTQLFATSVAAEDFDDELKTEFKEFIASTVFDDGEDIDDTITYVEIGEVVDVDSNGNILLVRRALAARALNGGSYIRIPYTVSVPVSNSNPSQGLIAISKVSAAISTQTFTTSLATAMGSSSFTAIPPVPPTVVSVITASTPAPTAAPTAAPTVRAKYTSSPIIIFSCFGGIGVLGFIYYCYHHHNPKVESAAASVSKPVSAGDVALVNRA
jgi:hypothetical protein